jgi:glycyl-tRNA synthetase
LDELRLEHGAVHVQGTPRRLVVFVEDVAPGQLDLEQVFKGPPASRAFSPGGDPTPAAEGFARSRGVAVSDLQVRELDGGRYVTAVVKQAGRPAPEVLEEALPGLLGGIRFDKSMRWNRANVAFSRPVRWLLAIYGDQVVPFEWAGLRAGRTTRGMRFQQPEMIEIENPAAYFQSMVTAGILLDAAGRQALILDQVQALASQVQGQVSPDQALLSEVANLVEAPAALCGSFDPSHLQLPHPVLISVMKKHQRYFPVETVTGAISRSPGDPKSAGPGALLPYFITVANKPAKGLEASENYPLVVEGNEHVIRARFADANFFVREDVKQPLEAYLPRLATLTFQVKLGSMLDKTHRIVALVEDLSPRLGLNAADTAAARRAAELCKGDLATNMVVEMTSLQGIMGRIYALRSGEPEAVAEGIFEHYLPRFAGDAVPQGRPGLVVGLADRLDTLSGLFAAGLAPTGNKDPFAQRRAALGLVQNLIAWDLDFDLRDGLSLAAGHLPVTASGESQANCLTFIVERLRNVLLEMGYRYDVVDAVVTAQGNNPAGAARAAKTLSEWVARPDWHTILPAYARCVRITRDFKEPFPVDPEHFIDPEERELYVALEKAEAAPRLPGAVDDFLNAFVPMIPAIDRFFDKVLVMAEDSRQRENRLGLLQRIATLAIGVADMAKLEGF